MKKPPVKKIENAFLPACEIVDSERFSGRESALADSFYALIADGSNIAVVGNRGIGKTSLARQVVNIGRGDNSVLDKINFEVDGALNYLTIYFACGNQIKSNEELLERLLTSSNSLSEWIYDIPNAKKVMNNYKPKFSVNPLGVGIEFGGTSSTEETISAAISSHSIDTVFTNVVNEIVKKEVDSNGILIVIDEFDQIKDPSGFASFLKAIATNCSKLKFCIIGVAKDIQSLMKEHESTDRLFAGSIISLESMTTTELELIITNAEKYIDNYIKFDQSAKNKIIALAQGHPYMVHLIGKFALRSAYQNSKKTISEEDINNTLSSIAKRKADPVLEGKYRKAVASSSHREIVLKALASAKDDHNEIWTTSAYKIALDKGVDNPSQYVGQLVIKEYGCEIEKLRDRYYRFKDSLFHAYVLARPSMYETNG